jgi:hypothetical protein
VRSEPVGEACPEVQEPGVAGVERSRGVRLGDRVRHRRERDEVGRRDRPCGKAPQERGAAGRGVGASDCIQREAATQLAREPASPADDSAASRVAAPPHEATVNRRSRDPAGDGRDGIGDSAASRDVLAQGYLRGDRPDRCPVEITLTIPASSLRPETADPVEVGELGESFVSGEAARRLSCNAGVVEVVEDDHGVPLSVGRKRRTIGGALKRALYKRESACTFSGCTQQVFLEGHHIKHWADGGETSLPNTALLCSLCRARHKLHGSSCFRVMPRRATSRTHDRARASGCWDCDIAGRLERG